MRRSRGWRRTCSRRSSRPTTSPTQRRQQHVEYHLAAGLLSGDAKTPIVRHGIKANRQVIETIAQYSLEQGLTKRLIKLDEIYAPNADGVVGCFERTLPKCARDRIAKQSRAIAQQLDRFALRSSQ